MAASQHQSHRFLDTLKRLLRRDAVASLKKILARTHPVDVAQVLDGFLPSDQIKLLSYGGSDERQSEIVSCLRLPQAVELLNEMQLERVVALLREMSGDDRADILGALEEEYAHEILAAMPDEESDEVAELMRYGESTAGGIMSPDVLSISEDVIASEAIGIVRDSPEVEMAFYIYVISSHGILMGVVSLRQLVTCRPDVELREIMNPHVVSVRTSEDQEEVARIVSRYDFLAVPVVDETNRLVGVVTVDDVIDVIREEATEDILKLAGAGEDLDGKQSLVSSVWKRAPWLVAAWAGGIVASFVIGQFEDLLQKYLSLAAFIPILLGMAGNVGTQSLTIVVRGLATRRIDVKQFWRVALREIGVGVVLGILFGAALGGMGFIQTQSSLGMNAIYMAIVISSSAALAMIMAALVGATMPMIFAKLHIDPAVATGPFVTTTIDVIGVFMYFNIAQALI
jgi:magnesium transporter